MSSVTLAQLSKSFGSTRVVPHLDLKVEENEFLTLLGPSGCGKTTVLRMIAGLECPNGGTIHIGETLVFDGKKQVNIPPEKRGLGMVFQNYAIWPHLNVMENVAFPLRCRKVAKGERETRSLEALANVKLQEFAHRKPHQLSGGQQQRVALARALVAEPKVLLLDEPLSNLDANLRDDMCAELESLRKRYKVTMIYVTHDQNEAFRLSDRIAILNRGEIAQMGTPKELRESPKNDFVKKFLKL